MTEQNSSGLGSESPPVNPGELLHAERLRVGFTTEEVATHLRLSKTTLGFLEEGRFDRLPGDTFARGYVRAYARLLKLDPNRLVLEYDRYVGADQRKSHVHSIDRVNETPRRGNRIAMTLSTIVVVGIMLILGLWWWSESRDTVSQQSEAGSSEHNNFDEVQIDSVLSADQIDSHSEELQPDLSAVDAAEQADEAPTAEVGSSAENTSPIADELPTTALAPASPAEPVVAEQVAVDADQSGLVMSFSDACWVQVSVPGGKVLHSAQMRKGEDLNITQTGPLELVVGAAGAVSKIEYNGQPVELKVNRQSGVARLRLGQ